MDMNNQESDDRGRIPNLIQIGAMPSDTAMDMDQEILDPVINTEDFCRFVLTNKGFLHSFSKITLSVNTNASSTFPANIGVHSLIRRCALRIGTTVVAETDDFNKWMGYKSLFIDNDINLERETYLTSRIMCHDLLYKDFENARSNVNASTSGLKTYLEYTIDADGQAGNLEPQKELKTSNAATFQVSVADLFPFLRFNQLPLYMIDQQVSIELHFQPSSTFERCIHESSEPQGVTYAMDNTQTKFVASYIYYDGELMSSYRDQNPVLEWTYNDYRLNKRSYSTSQLASTTTLDVGGAGRLISKVITALEFVSATPDTSILNAFTSDAPELASGNNGLFTTNMLYNDHRLYPIDRSNPALHFHDVVQAEQNVPQILRQEFNRQGGGLAGHYTYMQYTQSSSTQGLNGKFHYICYRPNRNERINSKGIQLELKYTALLSGSFVHRTWLEIIKNAKLERGMFSTDFA